MEGFCFVISITGLNRPNDNDDDDDDDDASILSDFVRSILETVNFVNKCFETLT
jgi:hypothetical protein